MKGTQLAALEKALVRELGKNENDEEEDLTQNRNRTMPGGLHWMMSEAH